MPSDSDSDPASGTARDNEAAPPFTRADPRTDAERRAFGAGTSYARVHDLSTPAEAAYVEALPAARRDVVRRLVHGLLRGSPRELPPSRVVSLSNPVVPDDPPSLAGLDDERLLAAAAPLRDSWRGLALLPFPASEFVLAAPVRSVGGYDRYRLGDPVRRLPTNGDGVTGEAAADAAEAGSSEAGADVTEVDDSEAATDAAEVSDPVTHPVDLVAPLAREGAFADGEQADRIRSELAESVANLALARVATPVRVRGVGDGSGSALDAVAEGVSAADPAAAFERIVAEGHPFHPSGKIRRGMTPAEGLAYAPEFVDRIDVRFVAVDRDYALETIASDADRFTDRLYETFDGLDAAVADAIPRSRNPEEYAAVPIHPWQYHRTLPDRYADHRADGHVVPLPEYDHPATPQLNLRTVSPYPTDRTGDGPLPQLKLAIGVQTTNVVRTLSPQAVTNGPQVTDLARAAEAAEPLEALGLLAEPAATCYFPPGGPHTEGDAYDDARHLSGLLRMHPASHPLVPDGARPVVAASLVAEAPGAGRPLVCEAIDDYAAATDATDPAQAALAFLDEYAGVAVPEQLLLLTKYGLALESHLQNCVVAFEGPRPVAVLVRDFGGIRVHAGRLAERDLSIDPYPESDLDADGESDLHAKLYYALFQNHLGELVATVADAYGPDESAYWARVRDHCERAFDRLRSDPAVPDERVRRDERALFAEPATHKALTAMRLRGKRHEYVTSETANPLVAPDSARGSADR